MIKLKKRSDWLVECAAYWKRASPYLSTERKRWGPYLLSGPGAPFVRLQSLRHARQYSIADDHMLVALTCS